MDAAWRTVANRNIELTESRSVSPEVPPHTWCVAIEIMSCCKKTRDHVAAEGQHRNENVNHPNETINHRNEVIRNFTKERVT